MKCAVVTPLLKKASLDKEELKNYRPVSNLSFISKITEKVTLSQISEHLDKSNLRSPLQSAYRKGHSTETALLRIQNDILRSLDKSRGVLLVLLDLSASFDTIDHAILASRLQQRIGITGSALMWIKSYLSHRQQTINVSGESSFSRELMYGVPQGSVMGPELFTIYSSVTYSIAKQHNINFHSYADDTQLYVSYDFSIQAEFDYAITRLVNCIKDLRLWMHDNKLKLNDDETEYFIITPSKSKSKLIIRPLKVGVHLVTPSRSAKNLGVYFQDNMSPNRQVLSIVKC